MYRFVAASLTSAHAVPCLKHGDSLKLMGFSSRLLFAVVCCIPMILVLGQPSQSLPTVSRPLKIPPTEPFHVQHNVFSWVLCLTSMCNTTNKPVLALNSQTYTTAGVALSNGITMRDVVADYSDLGTVPHE